MYLTTAIAYTNGSPHLGHAYELILSDAIARHLRGRGEPVFFTTGTDEHGKKIQKAAKNFTGSDNLTQMFVDSKAITFIDLAQKLNVKYDYFVRTTSPQHKETVKKVWEILEKKGLFYKKEYSGWYSVSDECLYSNEEIHTNSDSVIVSKETGSIVEYYTETNTFFKLSEFQEPLLKWFETNPIYPTNRVNEVKQIVKNGLQDLSVSRANVSWGIPVPGDETQTIYVWIDALTNYLTSIGWPNNSNWKKHWPATHIIGKDILKFHAVYWPAILLALDLPLPEKIIVHGWILDKTGIKQAKSLGNVTDPFEIVNKYGIDALRYFLLKIQVGDDGGFSEENINISLNNLANIYGNLINRLVAFQYKNRKIFEEFAECYDLSIYLKLSDGSKFIVNDTAILECFDNYNFPQGISIAFQHLSELNAIFQEIEPWKLIKTDPRQCYEKLLGIIQNIVLITNTLHCIMPDATSKILDMFYQDFPEPQIIFPKI